MDGLQSMDNSENGDNALCPPLTTGRLGSVVLAICTIVCPGLLAADEATVASLFGQRIRQAAATADSADDLALAKELLETALRDRKTRPKLFESLCLKSHELSMRAAGGDETAVRALTTLISHTRELPRRQEYTEKLVATCQAQFKRSDGSNRRSTGEALIENLLYLAGLKAGRKDYLAAEKQAMLAHSIATKALPDYVGETHAWIRHYRELSSITRRCRQLQTRLALSPQAAAPRNALIELLVVEQDQPAEAAKLLTDAAGQTWRTYVPLAVLDAKDLDSKQCFRLGQWYMALAEKARTVGRLRALSRARAYFDVVLSRPDSSDVFKLKAGLDARRAARGIEEAHAGILRTTSRPKLLVISRASFQKLYEPAFPGGNNVAHGGSAKVIGTHTGNPGGLLTGNSPCALKGTSGTFVFQWHPPVVGRFLLLIGSSAREPEGTWHNATMRVAGGTSIPISGFGADRVLIADFGKTRPFSSLRIDVKHGKSPGLSGVEIHAVRARNSAVP